MLDEDKREAGLRPIRDKGHAVVLDAIGGQRRLTGLHALDVGSGHGWFLEAASARGLVAVGIEPDRKVAERAQLRGLDVRVGFFPDDLSGDDQFDIVSFNDVLEHLPDLPRVLRAVRDRLRPDGLLAISIPTASGLGYRVATMLAHLRINAPLNRLWQRDFPSPHLWYFTERSLVRLATLHGFRLVASGRLPSIERDGLRERIATDPRSGPVHMAALAGVTAAAPLLNNKRFSDAMWLLFRTSGP
jgi:SAM-dependent methyltransferase